MAQENKLKQTIIAEYLAGDTSYRKLGKKYNLSHALIHKWMSQLDKNLSAKHDKGLSGGESSAEVRLLRKELKKQKLHNALLEEILCQVNKRTGKDWKKKFGAKRS